MNPSYVARQEIAESENTRRNRALPAGTATHCVALYLVNSLLLDVQELGLERLQLDGAGKLFIAA